MPVAKSYTRAQWDELVHSLESLPVKPEAEQRVSITDAMKEMRVVINAVRDKGYTLEEIVEHARGKGVDFSVGSVKYALYPSKKSRSVRQVVKESARGNAAPSSPAKKSKGDVTRSEAVGKSQKQDGGKVVNKPGTMVMRDAYSFEIRPDTENL
jgi:cysteinyl-tRNA synthetase